MKPYRWKQLKPFKKKRVLSEKQLNVLALAREKLKEKTKERQIKKD